MPKKILIIEDDPSLNRSLAAKLKEAGYEIYASPDGESGLKIADDKRPDLILLDLILPRKNGFDVLEELKGKNKEGGPKVVILTNLESSHDIERTFSLGAIAYLVKANYTLDEIVNKVNQLLSS